MLDEGQQASLVARAQVLEIVLQSCCRLGRQRGRGAADGRRGRGRKSSAGEGFGNAAESGDLAQQREQPQRAIRHAVTQFIEIVAQCREAAQAQGGGLCGVGLLVACELGEQAVEVVAEDGKAVEADDRQRPRT